MVPGALVNFLLNPCVIVGSSELLNNIKVFPNQNWLQIFFHSPEWLNICSTTVKSGFNQHTMNTVFLLPCLHSRTSKCNLVVRPKIKHVVNILLMLSLSLIMWCPLMVFGLNCLNSDCCPASGKSLLDWQGWGQGSKGCWQT